MDGVLVDFEGGFQNMTGKHPNQIPKPQFWAIFFGVIKQRAKKEKGYSEVKYWAELPWMSDGKVLWNYIKDYEPSLLTAPPNKQAEEGKTEWAKRIGSPPIVFKQARDKPQYAKKGAILIDDKQSTIDAWNAKGGIGIFHKSAADTIKQLKKLGL